jgi:predicted dehydrogenase
MTKKIKWGILGGGRIARKFAGDLQLVNEAELVAMASRDAEKVSFFAHEFKVKNVYHSYEELAKDPEVDVIYIATPHAMHHEHALLCIENNKAVLCEKAFAINTRQAKEMIGAAGAKKVFLMEALWSKFLPHYNKVQQLLKGKQLGELKSMLVNFGFIPAWPPPSRLFDPALGGGTLLDIGIYNVFMVLSVLGKPDSIEASATLTDKSIDEQCAVLFRYNNGVMAQLFSSFTSNLPTEAEINGDIGRIRLTTRFYEPSATIEYYPGHPDSKTIIPVEKENGLGYQYEARHVCECLQKGLTESPVMTHADTLLMMETLDAIRAKAGIRYLVD